MKIRHFHGEPSLPCVLSGDWQIEASGSGVINTNLLTPWAPPGGGRIRRPDSEGFTAARFSHGVKMNSVLRVRSSRQTSLCCLFRTGRNPVSRVKHEGEHSWAFRSRDPVSLTELQAAQGKRFYIYREKQRCCFDSRLTLFLTARPSAVKRISASPAGGR